MTRSISIIVFSFMITGLTYAQDTTSFLRPRQFKANLNLIGASLTYETKISRSNTLYLEAGAQYGFSYSYSSTFGDDYQYAFSPYLSAEARHYYHFRKRLDKGRNIANNGSNFWFVQGGYTFKPVSHSNNYNPSDALSIMPGWGIQRTFGKRFSFELNLGLQASFHTLDDSWYVGPGGGLKLGYIIE